MFKVIYHVDESLRQNKDVTLYLCKSLSAKSLVEQRVLLEAMLILISLSSKYYCRYSLIIEYLMLILNILFRDGIRVC